MRSTIAVRVCSVVVGLAVALAGGVVLAQRNDPAFHDAGAKIRGDMYWPSKAATRSFQHAHNYAQDFQTYTAKVEKPEPSVVADVKAKIGHYLAEGKQHLATMKKDFAADKETVAAIEKIEKDLAAAVQANAEMIKCCENATFDKAAGMECCQDFVKQLDKVHAAHQALMKKLTAKPAAPVKPGK